MRCHARGDPCGVFLLRSVGRRLIVLACHRKLSQYRRKCKRNRKRKGALDYAQYAAATGAVRDKMLAKSPENQQRLPLLKVCERLR